MLSASANKLSRLKEQAEEYAALIMEELDPERLGYIEVCIQYLYVSLCLFLLFQREMKEASHQGEAWKKLCVPT